MKTISSIGSIRKDQERKRAREMKTDIEIAEMLQAGKLKEAHAAIVEQLREMGCTVSADALEKLLKESEQAK